MEKYKNKEWLELQLQNKSAATIAQEIGCGEITIYRWKKKFGIVNKKYLYQDKAWLQEQLKTKNCKEIALICGAKQFTVQEWAKKLELDIHFKLYQDKSWVKKQLEEFNGSLTEICRKYGLKRYTLDQYCRKYGLDSSTRHRLYDINESYFKNINTEAKAYLLGFLMADGSMSKDLNRLSVCIQERDIAVVNLLKEQLHYQGSIERKINVYKQNTVTITICSQKLCRDLIYLGIVPRKSGKEVLPDQIPKPLIRHFIRGFLDGDGSITDACKGIIFCSKSRNILYSLKDIFEEQLCIKPYTLKIWTNTKTNHKLFYYKIYGDNAVAVAHYLYDNSNYFLKRKYEICKEKLFCSASQKCEGNN